MVGVWFNVWADSASYSGIPPQYLVNRWKKDIYSSVVTCKLQLESYIEIFVIVGKLESYKRARAVLICLPLQVFIYAWYVVCTASGPNFTSMIHNFSLWSTETDSLLGYKVENLTKMGIKRAVPTNSELAFATGLKLQIALAHKRHLSLAMNETGQWEGRFFNQSAWRRGDIHTCTRPVKGKAFFSCQSTWVAHN